MADAIAAGVTLCVVVTGLAVGYSTRFWWRVHREWQQRNLAIRLVEQERMSELTPAQVRLAKSYYYDRFAAKGREADKQRLEDLEVLEED